MIPMVTQNAKVIPPKSPKIGGIRFSEYYDLQETFDDLYAKSKEGKIFERLMEIILCRESTTKVFQSNNVQ